MTRNLLGFCIVIGMGIAGLAAAAPFGVAQPDSKLPVEVTSESLTVKDGENMAVFTGNVVIGRGEMRLNAPRVEVTYLEDQSGIKHVLATGGVTLVSGEDAAEGKEATYEPDSGVIVIRGNVLMTRGENAVTGDMVTVNTKTGTADVTGNVKTILHPKDKKEKGR